jgi:hypothetical protein
LWPESGEQIDARFAHRYGHVAHRLHGIGVKERL